MASKRLSTVTACRALRFGAGSAATRSIATTRSCQERPPTAPQPAIDIRHIRQNPTLYAQNCIERNYQAQSENAGLIISRFEEWKTSQEQSKPWRSQSNRLRAELSQGGNPNGRDEQRDRSGIIEQARELKDLLRVAEKRESALLAEIEQLAIALPNLTSEHTPRGDRPTLLGYIHESKRPAPDPRSHVDIGTELDILDFSTAAATSGWGWYFLKNEGALLEQALVQYALGVAMSHGFSVVTPPSIVYSHMASACGFQPRDQGGEQQIYAIAQDNPDAATGRPELCLAGTAEIPLAGSKASTDMKASELPLRYVGPSRCYRAEAGSRGADTKGLYRVHEFTKVEMFGWTLPNGSQEELFNTMVGIQKKVLESLGLRCRILEQPSADLGASATRKQDIEAYFPSRHARDSGWGEVTSTSMCTDYQTRRLATRVRLPSGKLIFPYTVNGTAIAVPRVLAAILENHWDEATAEVKVPEVLWPWMHGIKVIGRGS